MPDEIHLGRDLHHYIVAKSERWGGVAYVRADRPDIVAALALIEACRAQPTTAAVATSREEAAQPLGRESC